MAVSFVVAPTDLETGVLSSIWTLYELAVSRGTQLQLCKQDVLKKADKNC